MKYTTVIFDLDGTLLDTLDDLTDGVNHALADFGYPLADREQIRARLGYGSGHLIAESVPGGRDCPDYQAVFDDYLAYYRAHSSVKTRPYGGIPELLAALGRRGVRCAIVSNKPDSAAVELGERWFAGLVETTVGERPGIRRKPAPDSLLEVMRRLGAEAASTAYVGDSEVDIDTARAAGGRLRLRLLGLPHARAARRERRRGHRGQRRRPRARARKIMLDFSRKACIILFAPSGIV